ncbi:hypothetical protein [Salinibaculum rarum]|uniref:hypothetical protein n=1 Tax=Salinibaculum rarum TaxID=3058903 RepID=UPI00265FD1F7|nr:hypothetical protein [Salinibaculum sp. KK48]
MLTPLHIGIEHPTLGWLAIVALLAFVAGLGVNLSRSVTGSAHDGTPAADEDSE